MMVVITVVAGMVMVVMVVLSGLAKVDGLAKPE